ncbi:MAG: alpha/beta hydrolase, partial [Pseudolysinimonas sp.]
TQSPRGWDRLVGELEILGHRAVAVELANSIYPSSQGFAAEIGTQVPKDFVKPIVVAHSGSGPLLSAVSSRLSASHQVWLAALVPDGQQSLQEEISAGPETIFNPEWIGVDPTQDDALATYFLFHDVGFKTLQWARSTLRLFAPSALYSELNPPHRDIPSTYICGTLDRVLKPSWAIAAAQIRLGAEIVEMSAGHCPHVSQPRTLARILANMKSG